MRTAEEDKCDIYWKMINEWVCKLNLKAIIHMYYSYCVMQVIRDKKILL
jgi:hypothetical protein